MFSVQGLVFLVIFSGSVFCTGYLIARSRVCWEVIAALDVGDDWNGENFVSSELNGNLPRMKISESAIAARRMDWKKKPPFFFFVRCRSDLDLCSLP